MNINEISNRIAKEIVSKLKPTKDGKDALNKVKKILSDWSGENFNDITNTKNTIMFTIDMPTLYKSVEDATENWEENGSSFQRRMRQNYGAADGKSLYENTLKEYKSKEKEYNQLAKKVQSAVGNIFNVKNGISDGRTGEYAWISLGITNKSLEASNKKASKETVELAKEWEKADKAVNSFHKWANNNGASRKTLQHIINAQTEIAKAYKLINEGLKSI